MLTCSATTSATVPSRATLTISTTSPWPPHRVGRLRIVFAEVDAGHADFVTAICHRLAAQAHVQRSTRRHRLAITQRRLEAPTCNGALDEGCDARRQHRLLVQYQRADRTIGSDLDMAGKHHAHFRRGAHGACGLCTGIAGQQGGAAAYGQREGEKQGGTHHCRVLGDEYRAYPNRRRHGSPFTPAGGRPRTAGCRGSHHARTAPAAAATTADRTSAGNARAPRPVQRLAGP
ncbi:hypothetical protein G6F23_012860 [Rhizopus arrhizus]|nr:hypothetical protein G6F23_012860 [Rhizopus arrhizus]